MLLLWYKNEILALENSSPAEGAYAEGLYNAKLTQVRRTLHNLLNAVPLVTSSTQTHVCRDIDL